jgi:hypothetical protein
VPSGVLIDRGLDLGRSAKGTHDAGNQGLMTLSRRRQAHMAQTPEGSTV